MVAEVTKQASAGQTVWVRLLGEFAITAGNRAAGPWPRPSARRLCTLLLVSPGRRISRDLACEELFPNLDPRAAARSLSKALSMARTALAPLGEAGGALLGADLTHLWLSAPIAVDADLAITALRAALALPPGQARDDALSAALADDPRCRTALQRLGLRVSPSLERVAAPSSPPGRPAPPRPPARAPRR